MTAADATKPASSEPPASASAAEAAPQTLLQAAAGLLTVLAAAVAERCLVADEAATDRRAAELQVACDPDSPLWPRFREGSSEAPAPCSMISNGGKECSSSNGDAEALSHGLHQTCAPDHGREAIPGLHGWTADANVQHRQAESVAAAACGTIPPAPVLVLFSGGVDSTLLAALAHQVQPLAKLQMYLPSPTAVLQVVFHHAQHRVLLAVARLTMAQNLDALCLGRRCRLLPPSIWRRCALRVGQVPTAWQRGMPWRSWPPGHPTGRVLQ